MENVFDQEADSTEIKNKIVEQITEQAVVESLSAEDYTVVDESEIDWSKL
jgi:hypothetical protein